MSFVGDIIVISGLAITVYKAYKHAAPDGYQHIPEEVEALQVLINKVAQHFRRTTISSDDRLNGLKVLKGCQVVLEDLDSLIKKYKSLISVNKGIVMRGVKLGKVDLTTLESRLISNTGLLHDFVQGFVVPALLLC